MTNCRICGHPALGSTYCTTCHYYIGMPREDLVRTAVQLKNCIDEVTKTVKQVRETLNEEE
jgi:hypothetical protein